MFTGLVQDIGRIERVSPTGSQSILTVSTSFKNLELGESVAVNGVCLTVTECLANGFSAYASKETLSKSSLGGFDSGSRVNLERALKPTDRLGGHIVAGHIDTVVNLLSRRTVGDSERLSFSLPSDHRLTRQLAPKGSVAIDGVSLTINNVFDDNFDLMAIPLTLKNTTLRALKIGDAVNLETDIMAKYIARQLETNSTDTSGIDMELLIRSGFVR